jgi:GNAT superfamily N-acetyltransferase
MGLTSWRTGRHGAGMKLTSLDTTVTYLAMTARPSHLPPMPTSPRLALMKAEKIPLHFYRYLYGAVGGSWLWVERLHMSDDALVERVHRDGVEVFVLYANGSPAGYFELDFGNTQSTKLVYFGLMPEWTGLRIGPWFLGAAIHESLSRGAGEVLVNTCTLDHPAALPLYQKLGFQPIRRESRRLRIPAGVAVPSHITARMTPEVDR